MLGRTQGPCRATEVQVAKDGYLHSYRLQVEGSISFHVSYQNDTEIDKFRKSHQHIHQRGRLKHVFSGQTVLKQ